MLTSIEARNSAGQLLTLSMENVTNGLYIEDVKGLDPVKATIASSQQATRDGVQFQSIRREARNIVITLGLEPDWATDTIETLRDRVYDFFMSGEPVQLRLIDSRPRTVDISGRVETCETPLFAKESTVDISIMCFEPDFVDITPVVVPGDSVNDTEEMLVNYAGTAKVGVVYTINIDRTVSEITIYHRPPDDTLRSMEISVPLVDGDILTISTVVGDKYIRLNRLGTVSSVLYGRSTNSDWTRLERGPNNIRVYITGASIPYTMTYVPRYGGM